jgi:hypothetical protein
VARQVREVMEGLKQRFPDDIAYTVFFDNTVFVTDTVAEVYAPCCCGAAMERSAGPCAMSWGHRQVGREQTW